MYDGKENEINMTTLAVLLFFFFYGSRVWDALEPAKMPLNPCR